MGTSPHGQLPPDRVRGLRRFLAWRRVGRGMRAAGSRMQPPGTRAIRLAKTQGVRRTFPALGLDSYYLKKPVEAEAGRPRGGRSVLLLFPGDDPEIDGVFFLLVVDPHRDDLLGLRPSHIEVVGDDARAGLELPQPGHQPDV